MKQNNEQHLKSKLSQKLFGLNYQKIAFITTDACRFYNKVILLSVLKLILRMQQKKSKRKLNRMRSKFVVALISGLTHSLTSIFVIDLRTGCLKLLKYSFQSVFPSDDRHATNLSTITYSS